MSVNLQSNVPLDQTDLNGTAETNNLLKLILIELRIMNAYNSVAHDEVLTEEDIEDEHN